MTTVHEIVVAILDELGSRFPDLGTVLTDDPPTAHDIVSTCEAIVVRLTAPNHEGYWWCWYTEDVRVPVLVHDPTDDGLQVNAADLFGRCSQPVDEFRCLRWGPRIPWPGEG